MAVPPGSTPRAAPPRPLVVAVGAATRDLVADDPRGWRLGGGVVYGALALARLGLRVVAVVGLDREAATADELGVLARAGVELRSVELERGAVFENREGPGGRRQRVRSWPEPIAPEVLEPLGVTAAAEVATGWLFAPIAGEVPAGWAELPRPEALVALSWQGLLRRPGRGGWVERRPPGPDPLLARADLVAASVEDLGPAVDLGAVAGLLRPTARLAVTAGEDGGLVGERLGEAWRWRRYRAIPSRGTVDPTGAGDVFLAALLAARLEPRLVGGRLARGGDVLLAAAAASCSVEAPGIAGIAEPVRLSERLADLGGRRSG
jgi:sugar/nucleoside kinase (ribokinase family)